MPAVTLPDPALSDGVIALRGFDAGDIEALVAAPQDPEIPRWTLVPIDWSQRAADVGCDHLPDVFFARLRGG